jgi:hypothetical protein
VQVTATYGGPTGLSVGTDFVVTTVYSAPPATFSGTLSAGGATQALTGVYTGPQPQPVLIRNSPYTLLPSAGEYVFTLINNSATLPMTLIDRWFELVTLNPSDMTRGAGVDGVGVPGGTTCVPGMTIPPGGSCVFKTSGFAIHSGCSGSYIVKKMVTVSSGGVMATVSSDPVGWYVNCS